MRLRNIPRAESTIEAHDAVINQPEAERGKWVKVFSVGRYGLKWMNGIVL